MIQILSSLRQRLRDSLPHPFGLFLTLRANPFLGLLFLLFRRRFNLNGMAFRVPIKHQSWSSLATYWFNDYELPERTFGAKFIRPTDRVCELGGCLGIVSMTINSRLDVSSSHLVIEANPALIPFLESNRLTNGGHFQILNRAIGDGSALNLDTQSGVLTSMVSLEHGAKTVTVPGSTVDSLFEEYGPFDALVMDIEGAEEKVFLGEGQSWMSVRVIIVEMHPAIIGQGAYLQAQSKLTEAGFKLVASQTGDPHIVEVWEKVS
jgi:FkbM family methyltransferase